MEAQELRNAWLDRALQSAGIDRARWRPVRGVEENARTIEAVYRYYGQLSSSIHTWNGPEWRA